MARIIDFTDGFTSAAAPTIESVSMSTLGDPTIDNSVVRADGTTGNFIQNSSVTIDDDGVITAAGLVLQSLNGFLKATAGVVSVDTSVTTLTGTQTLTNKTLTAPTITNPVISNPIGLVKADVGLDSVDNTSDATKNSAVATLTNKTLTSPVINSPTGIVKGDVGLGNVDNTSDATKNSAAATLTNKILTAPVINNATADTITGIAAGPLALTGATNQNVNITVSGTGVVSVNGIQVNSSNQVIATAAADLEVRAKTGQNTKINAFTGDVQLQRDNVTIASAKSGTLQIASGKTLSFSANSQVVSIAGNPSATASYGVTLPAAAPTGGTALVYNGTDYVWASAGGWNMNTATSLSSNGTIPIALTTGQQVFEVAGASTPVTLSNTPFGTSAPNNGTVVRLIGRSSTAPVFISNYDAAKGCILNGSANLHLGYVIELQYFTSLDRWVEISRNF